MMSKRENVMRSMISRRAVSKVCGGWRSRATGGHRRAARGEKGFTLIELLIVVTIMPIIVGAISGGLFTVLSLQTTTANRLADTSDGQIISSTFIKDVQSSTFITTMVASTPQCDSSAGYTQLLGLQWGNSTQDIANGVSTNPSTLISYDIVPVTGGPTTTYSLVREECTSGNYATPSSSTIVSNDIIGTGANTQPRPCYTSASCTDSDDPVHNPQIGWTSPAATISPNSPSLKMPVVKFVLTEANSKILFTLMANSLSWTPAAAGGTVGPPFSPVTLLSQAPGIVLNMQSAAVINITGSGIAGTTAAFASPNDGSVVIPGDAALNASQAFTEDPNLETITGAGLGGPQVDPIPQYFTSPIPDPMLPIIAANQLTAPTASSAWPLTPGLGACTGTFPTFTCGQGDYTTAPTFPTGSNVTFNAGFGNYEFNTPFIIPLNSNITFGEGNYVFDGSPAIEAVTPPAYQTLTWTTIPSTSLTTGGSYTPSATSSSGLPVTITLDSASSGCTLIAGVVKLTGTTGTCLVDANQEAVGSTSFYPAAQIQQVVPVPKSSSAPQVVSFSTTQPSPATIGSTYNVIAATTLTSSIPTVTSETPSVCTVASSGTVVVAFKTAGECVIDANDGASGSTLRAPEAQQAIVVSPGNGLPTTIIGNNVLFYVRPTGGSIDFGDNSAVELTPLSSGVAIWDAAASSVTINNVADNRNTFGGIYIPGGSVNATTTSNSGTMSVMFIVASTMTMAPVVTLNVTGP
jgi:prepilin-type N-terminal cleavage/methylation domain-containing protein